MIDFILNDKKITAFAKETIFEAALRHGVKIPHLCHKEGYKPDGNCRACVVEIEGERVLAPSCCRYPSAKMIVKSNNQRAQTAQKMVLELLLSDMPKQLSASPYKYDSGLAFWCDELKVKNTQLPRREIPKADESHPAIAVNLDACIHCGLCVRACRDVQCNDVIGLAYSSQKTKIIFDLDTNLKKSTCVACGECVQACPTGALTSKQEDNFKQNINLVDSICPFCGVGCLLTYKVSANQIIGVEGREGPANHSRLCVKGRYGFDYAHNKQRLTTPLIRKKHAKKSVDKLSPEYMQTLFEPASWEDALDFAAQGLKKIKADKGVEGLAGFGSAKCSNEEAYLFQKLVRVGFGNNNVDHCTRLCHASSVYALLEGIGSGAVSNPFNDAVDADVIIVIGANPTVNHPVAASFFKNAAKAGKTLIEINPMRTELSRFATHVVQFRSTTDVLLLNAMMFVIIQEGLFNKDYIEKHTEGFEALKKSVMDYAPETVSSICGISADVIKDIARKYATAARSIIFWGMGISQHTNGTDNARCLIGLALMCGQIGRAGTGLHPLRGQNNVQGASDSGLIPMTYPDYKPVEDEAVRGEFEEFWQTKLNPKAGKTVIEIIHAIDKKQLFAMYIMGENPAMSDPNLNHTRQSLANLEHLVVQDIFYTETAALADVILPASAFAEKTGTFTNTNRQVQLGRKALESPGKAKLDWQITQEIGRRLGLKWQYQNEAEIFAEMRQIMPSINGITWQRLEQESSVTYPCEHEGDAGENIIFKNGFPRKNGKGLFVPTQASKSIELPDQHYPFVLITGRILEHWHTGSMTRKSNILNALEPSAFVSMHPEDIAQHKINGEQVVKIRSRRGEVNARVRTDDRLQVGSVFMPFCFAEAPANILTREDIDPNGKIPAFKYCAVAIEH